MSEAPQIALVAAVADNGVIGNGNRLPWHIPTDLKRFRTLTLGHPIIMGRRTYESIGRALPGRTNIVLSRGEPALPEECVHVRSLDEAFAAAQAVPACEQLRRVCVIGGAAVYRATIARAARLFITRVHAAPAGDAHFPPIGPEFVLEHEEHPAPAARDAFPVTFLTYRRAP